MERIITQPDIEAYIDKNKSVESPLLVELERTTHLKALSPQMLSGQTQGHFLSIISKMLQPKRILEIGTYTGFSALCMAEGLSEEGLLYTLDINPEIAPIAQAFFDKSPYADQIRFIQGNAKEIIPILQETWDLVFIDADKDAYADYYDLVLPYLRTGGVILADNVLWYGRILDKEMDKKTKAIHQFNQKLANDPRVKSVIVPMRDGIHMAVKL